LMKDTADPAALEHLHETASRNGTRSGSRYLQGLHLASQDTL
jgi:hypothetical protein